MIESIQTRDNAQLIKKQIEINRNWYFKVSLI